MLVEGREGGEGWEGWMEEGLMQRYSSHELCFTFVGVSTVG